MLVAVTRASMRKRTTPVGSAIVCVLVAMDRVQVTANLARIRMRRLTAILALALATKAITPIQTLTPVPHATLPVTTATAQVHPPATNV